MNTASHTRRETRGGAAARRAGARDLVFGIGETGLSVARYLKRNGRAARFVDTRTNPPGLDELADIDPDADVVLGKMTRDLLKNTARIIASPGVPDKEPLLAAARAAGIEVISDIELFAREARAPFIAVTGSNGKSTVTTLLGLMFGAAGMKALAGANLGHPALDMLALEPPELYVLELSSFQLMRTETLPAAVAVLLNISPDHLDWHSSEAEYRAAKHRIFRQAKAAVFNRDEPGAEAAIPDGVPRVSFGIGEPVGKSYGLVQENGEQYLAHGEQLLLSTGDMALVGMHNHANALAALAAGHLMGLELSPMLQVLTEFPGLPHRMEYVATIGGTDYIDDSKATNIGAAIASVASIEGLVVLIAGGDAKGGDFEAFADAIYRKLRAAVLIGRDGPRIAAALKGLAPVYQAAEMRTAVSIAASIAAEGDTVLLAPACASFDQYRNYAERGLDFRRSVEALAT
jgi:UDP-N-acetylmuramoylalanine--D-glutamate ligase